MNKKLALAVLTSAAILQSTSAFANMFCTLPQFGFRDRFDNVLLDEQQAAEQVERELRSAGIDAHGSRFWNDCLQTFVLQDGRRVMKFYDPYSLREISPERASSF